MPIDFFNFSSKIRIKVYKELLVVPEIVTIELNLDSPSRPYMVRGSLYLYPEVLLANKMAHHEAGPLLYSGNYFQFGIDMPVYEIGYDTEYKIFTSFLNYIGLQNTGFLSYLYIAFPAYNNHRPGGIALEDNSMSTLNLIRDICTDIAMLKMVLQSDTTAEALAVVHTQLNSMPLLKDIKVVVDDGLLCEDLIEKMRNWGWTVKVVELKEASDRFGSNSWGYNDDDYGDEYGDDDNI
ncbi:hypothetical protein BGZ61DRAFT_376531 [Ilyonectria robusta]|uniref:uncharacterized protein n=1 Tax=Ilyonectria robusta TaxID=1079257 RepID=UPI001E8CE7B3|nr:uncharacterized protein BGZ61DRAFT_376531 [Ilyonectria robusta]KAH8648107.1 hypothetical protein BGZ61DRAFT_376531 [Ilyonectria robusta]